MVMRYRGAACDSPSYRMILLLARLHDIVRTYAVAPFRVTKLRFACGSMVLFDHMSVVFALVEHKNDRQEKGKYH